MLATATYKWCTVFENYCQDIGCGDRIRTRSKPCSTYNTSQSYKPSKTCAQLGFLQPSPACSLSHPYHLVLTLRQCGRWVKGTVVLVFNARLTTSRSCTQVETVERVQRHIWLRMPALMIFRWFFPVMSASSLKPSHTKTWQSLRRQAAEWRYLSAISLPLLLVHITTNLVYLPSRSVEGSMLYRSHCP